MMEVRNSLPRELSRRFEDIHAEESCNQRSNDGLEGSVEDGRDFRGRHRGVDFECNKNAGTNQDKGKQEEEGGKKLIHDLSNEGGLHVPRFTEGVIELR